MENMIEIKNVVKSYNIGTEKLTVLKNINLTVAKGEFLAILGPSGSGKSTLMNIIGCMDKFDSGEYYLNGEPIHKYGDAQLTNVRNKHIGFIFQKYQLIPKYSVLQNVMMPLLVRGMSRHQAIEISKKQIEMLGMSDRGSHKPSELSGGQQQRAAIARALVGKPSILLADEPTGALDSSTGKDVLELFKQLNEMGNTIIMITHDLNVAASAKRIIKIVDGNISE
ncbi:MAG TPA: macrolide ABC transporter ATP-binding protein [Ruminococcaceae bacterium]|nr:macrolide ABC transporter ATP-binding protein [Oscillospiraceae bacterium]